MYEDLIGKQVLVQLYGSPWVVASVDRSGFPVLARDASGNMVPLPGVSGKLLSVSPEGIVIEFPDLQEGSKFLARLHLRKDIIGVVTEFVEGSPIVLPNPKSGIILPT